MAGTMICRDLKEMQSPQVAWMVTYLSIFHTIRPWLTWLSFRYGRICGNSRS
jgi:hypothetical protein